MTRFESETDARYEGWRVALASSVGQSDEFVALRDYRRGDPLRHIHWKSVSKTGRTMWSSVYDLTTGNFEIAYRQQFDHPYKGDLAMSHQTE